MQHEFEPIEGFIGLAQNEINVGKVVQATDVLGIHRQDLLVDFFGGQELLLFIIAHGDTFKNLEVVLITLFQILLEVLQGLIILSLSITSLAQQLECL